MKPQKQLLLILTPFLMILPVMVIVTFSSNGCLHNDYISDPLRFWLGMIFGEIILSIMAFCAYKISEDIHVRSVQDQNAFIEIKKLIKKGVTL